MRRSLIVLAVTVGGRDAEVQRQVVADLVVVCRVEADPMLQASLAAQIGQALGMAEQQAVLQAMREAANVRVLPEGEEALKAGTQQQG